MKNLERIRKKKKMTREKLAQLADSNYFTIRAYEKGYRQATVKTAARIAKVLDVTIEDLMK